VTATELIGLIVRWAFVLIAAVTLFDFARLRSQARLDIALMFSALAGVILVSGVARSLGAQGAWLTFLVFFLLLAQPYLLLRLVGHFQPLSRRANWVALGGLAVCALVLLGSVAEALPTQAVFLTILYFVVLEAYATWQFARISLRSTGPIRLRTFFAALGSGWLAAAILSLLLPALVPAAAGLAAALLQVFALLSVICDYLGFAPPPPLRRAWQLAELHRFLRRLAGRPITERLEGALAHLCPAATHTVGALASAVYLWDGAGSERLLLQATDQPGQLPEVLAAAEGALAQVVAAQPLVQANAPGAMGSSLATVAARLGAGSLLVVPIGQHGRRWGMLLNFRALPSLFPGDDAEILRLFADQAAEVLESAELFHQQRALVEKLELANKDLESFSYSVSHDLRAPLRAMNGFSQVLLEDHLPELSPQAQHYVRRIQSNSQKMGNLVDDLLAFSRFGRQPLKLQTLDPVEVARQAWDDLRHDTEGRTVELELGSLRPALADASLLRQVYVNLLSNALKFTRQQSVARITVDCREDGDSTITYFVRDNGVGFDMAYANKLFGVFQRLHRAEDFEGTGVGLAIVQRIIERHGGRVSAESSPGQGATFYFTLKGA
jgi:signal transduction histidine kinase